MRPIEFIFEFVACYEVQQLERIDRQFSPHVLAFPGAVSVDRQQEIPERDFVGFADLTNLIAYGPDGIVWRSGRVALDELEIIRAKGDVLHVAGFFGSVNRAEFTVDLRTGRPSGAPYEFDEEGGFRQESGG